jgi:hypothetical protein
MTIIYISHFTHFQYTQRFAETQPPYITRVTCIIKCEIQRSSTDLPIIMLSLHQNYIIHTSVWNVKIQTRKYFTTACT